MNGPLKLGLDQIRIDGGTQPRVLIDEQVVADYAELYSTGVDLPPVTVFFDGASYWLADGFHRCWANRRINCDYVYADVRQGTQRDAQWHSFGDNSEHGLRRTRDDVAHILKMMFADDQWAAKSDSDIAKHAGIPRRTVYDHRQRYLGESAKIDPGQREVTRNGKTYQMNTGNIGRAKSPPRPGSARKPGGLSTKAIKPGRSHSIHYPKVALELPHDPHGACRTIVSALGNDFARALIAELTSYLQAQKAGDP